MSDWSQRRLHFIGIGGAGMSGLALVCARLGATVTGSDRAESSYMERLREAGLEPAVGHDAANLPDGAEVVVSTAIGEDNPELAAARERGVEPIHRGALLAELCAEKRLIAVAGTHGKTTTTAMLVWALRALGADPAFFVGGEVPGLGPAARARGQRRLGRGRVGRRRGGRERRQLPRAEAGDRRDHQHRDGPPLALGLGRRAARRLRRVLRRRPARRVRRGLAGAGRAAASGPRPPQPAERPRRAGRGRARRPRRRGAPPRRWPTSPACGGGSS